MRKSHLKGNRTSAEGAAGRLVALAAGAGVLLSLSACGVINKITTIAGKSTISASSGTASSGAGATTPTPEPTESKVIKPWDLTVGTCFNDPKAQVTGESTISSVATVPCSVAHNAQVAALVVYGPGKGLSELSLEVGGNPSQMQTDCEKQFKVKLKSSAYKLYLTSDSNVSGYFIYPDITDWDSTGSNTVACVVTTKKDGKVSLLK
jgi:hypothetical protein